ncbi:hypothetical protein CEXT_706291 [Caerostris extrusa]|uniref:Uncharacterized protein n=1 Tax=Caerostris extrusa TaxID=172846 RepID=A0AAV4U2Y7_CAEEX|nr:hypothetical protein CEXT_706291 [Caerostris extrusa]
MLQIFKVPGELDQVHDVGNSDKVKTSKGIVKGPVWRVKNRIGKRSLMAPGANWIGLRSQRCKALTVISHDKT